MHLNLLSNCIFFLSKAKQTKLLSPCSSAPSLCHGAAMAIFTTFENLLSGVKRTNLLPGFNCNNEENYKTVVRARLF